MCHSGATKEDMSRAFAEYDIDKNGFISLHEAQEVLNTKFGFPDEQTRRLVDLCDKNKDGRLSYAEFADFFVKVKERISEIQKIFNDFDKNQDGSVSLQEAKDAMKNFDFSEAEIEALVTTHDVNKDGRLQYEEFVKFWNAK